jgi:hypothetical protein
MEAPKGPSPVEYKDVISKLPDWDEQWTKDIKLEWLKTFQSIVGRRVPPQRRGMQLLPENKDRALALFKSGLSLTAVYRNFMEDVNPVSLMTLYQWQNGFIRGGLLPDQFKTVRLPDLVDKIHKRAQELHYSGYHFEKIFLLLTDEFGADAPYSPESVRGWVLGWGAAKKPAVLDTKVRLRILELLDGDNDYTKIQIFNIVSEEFGPIAPKNVSTIYSIEKSQSQGSLLSDRRGRCANSMIARAKELFAQGIMWDRVPAKLNKEFKNRTIPPKKVVYAWYRRWLRATSPSSPALPRVFEQPEETEPQVTGVDPSNGQVVDLVSVPAPRSPDRPVSVQQRPVSEAQIAFEEEKKLLDMMEAQRRPRPLVSVIRKDWNEIQTALDLSKDTKCYRDGLEGVSFQICLYWQHDNRVIDKSLPVKTQLCKRCPNYIDNESELEHHVFRLRIQKKCLQRKECRV